MNQVAWPWRCKSGNCWMGVSENSRVWWRGAAVSESHHLARFFQSIFVSRCGPRWNLNSKVASKFISARREKGVTLSDRGCREQQLSLGFQGSAQGGAGIARDLSGSTCWVLGRLSFTSSSLPRAPLISSHFTATRQIAFICSMSPWVNANFNPTHNSPTDEPYRGRCSFSSY